jgi:hypothetical protein
VRLALSLWAVACSSGPRPAPAPPIANATAETTTSCMAAAAGLEHATAGVRDPDSSVLAPMRARCTEDRWLPPARACFAQMQEGELARCAALLDDKQRAAMFDVLGGGDGDRTQLVIARARLQAMVVGIAECDRFIAVVANALTCERMPLDARLQLGSETASFWDLPTGGLPPDARRRMAAVCSSSLAQLQQQVIGAGCMP